MAFTFWDLLLIAVVSVQSALPAYLHSPRAKALTLTFPFPFTTITLALGRPIDATNVFALVVLFVYSQGVRLFHQRLRVPIVPAIVLSLLCYCLIGWALAGTFPTTEAAFWTTAAAVFALGLTLHCRMPLRMEPGHRTSLPPWIKLPIVVAVVCLLILIKGALQGFATLFPLVSILGAYETRHSLWTFGKQVPVLMVALIPLMAVSRLTQAYVGLGLSLALGWIVFLACLYLTMRPMWAEWDAARAEASGGGGQGDSG